MVTKLYIMSNLTIDFVIRSFIGFTVSPEMTETLLGITLR